MTVVVMYGLQLRKMNGGQNLYLNQMGQCSDPVAVSKGSGIDGCLVVFIMQVS